MSGYLKKLQQCSNSIESQVTDNLKILSDARLGWTGHMSALGP